MPIRTELIDELLQDYKKPEDMVGENGLLKQLTKALIERALGAELTHQLGYEKHSAEGKNSGNSRNGTSPKTLKSDLGDLPIEVPRDRRGDFEPQIVKKGQRRFNGFDDKILSMYARGMTTRDIQAHLFEIYKVDLAVGLGKALDDEREIKQKNSALESEYKILTKYNINDYEYINP